MYATSPLVPSQIVVECHDRKIPGEENPRCVRVTDPEDPHLLRWIRDARRVSVTGRTAGGEHIFTTVMPSDKARELLQRHAKTKTTPDKGEKPRAGKSKGEAVVASAVGEE